MFDKLLIADRGEVVLRIARTCERLGIVTVAVHAADEAGAAHATNCDEAVEIDRGEAAHAYLNADGILAAAKQHGAQAIHPGYGALSQDAGFARKVKEAGLVLIGPAAEALERFADLPKGREVARQAGVRVLESLALEPGAPSAFSQAQELGYPIAVVAAADRRIVETADDDEELPEAIERCSLRIQEAALARGIYLQPVVERPRLLGVMVIADGRGECVTLTDFEHSLLRRDLTLIAECPAPAWTSMPSGTRRRQTLCDSAASIALEGQLVGPATAEFVLDMDGQIRFSHMRLGLPPEHVLWEMCTGLDLLEVQLRLAAGEPLPTEIKRQPSGNAVEGRIYAELPPNHARTETAEIKALRWPVVAPGALRIETDLAVGTKDGTNYDPLVGKVVAYGQSRHQSLLTLDRVLAEATIDPLPTNLPFLREILADESFRAGQYASDFADRLLAELRAAPR